MGGPEEDLPGTLVMVADPVLQDGIWSQNSQHEGHISFYNQTCGAFESVDARLVRATGILALPSEFEHSELVGASDYIEEYLEAGTVGEIIMDGRFDLALLLNSGGGVQKTRKIIQGLARHSRRNHGKVSTCVGGRVANEATLAFMIAERDRRLVFPQSKISYSLDATVFAEFGTPRPLNAESQLAQWGDLRTALTRDTKSDQQARIAGKISDVEAKPEGKRLFKISGAEADKLGIAEIAWANRDEPGKCLALMGRFSEMHGISQQAILASHGVGGFFGRNCDYFRQRLTAALCVNEDEAAFLALRWCEQYGL